MTDTHRISRITVHPVAYPEPNDSHATRYLTFVRIESGLGVEINEKVLQRYAY